MVGESAKGSSAERLGCPATQGRSPSSRGPGPTRLGSQRAERLGPCGSRLRRRSAARARTVCSVFGAGLDPDVGATDRSPGRAVASDSPARGDRIETQKHRGTAQPSASAKVVRGPWGIVSNRRRSPASELTDRWKPGPLRLGMTVGQDLPPTRSAWTHRSCYQRIAVASPRCDRPPRGQPARRDPRAGSSMNSSRRSVRRSVGVALPEDG